MDNKKIIIIGIIILIIAAGIIFIMLTTVNYERIEITPNGTTIEVPANQTKYDGEIQSTKIWNWNSGILVTYNSNADRNIVKVSEVGFNTLNEIVKHGEKQNIDGYTCYVINADDILEIHIFDIIKINYNGKFYCIPLSNESTHDNIIICSNNKDIAVHMAQSVEYKNVYPDNNELDNTIAAAKSMSGDLLSKANDYAKNINLSNVKSEVKDRTGVNLDDVQPAVEKKTGEIINNVKPAVEQYTGKLPI